MSAATSSLNAKAQPFQSNQSPKDPDNEHSDGSDRRVTPIPIENSTLERNHEVLNRLRAEILAGRHPLYKAPSDIAKGISELPERYQQGLQLPAPNDTPISDVGSETNTENAAPLSARIEPATVEASSSKTSLYEERPAAKVSPAASKRPLAAHLNDEPPHDANGQDTPSAAKRVRTHTDETSPTRNGQSTNDIQTSPTASSPPVQALTSSREERASVAPSASSSATKDTSALSLADRLAPPPTASDSLQRSTSGDKYSGQRLPPASQEERDRMRELRDRLIKERGAITRDRLEEAKNKNIDRYIPDRNDKSERSKPDYHNKAERSTPRDRQSSDTYDRHAWPDADRPPYSASTDRSTRPADDRMPNLHRPLPPRDPRDEDRPLRPYAQERSVFREPSRLIDTDRSGPHGARLDDRTGPTTAPLPMSQRGTDCDPRFPGAPHLDDYDQRRRSDLGSSRGLYDRPEAQIPYGHADRKQFDERDRDRRLAELDVLWSRPADRPAARPGQDRRDLPSVQSARSDRYDTRDVRGGRDPIPPYQREADYPSSRFQPPASAPLPFYPERHDKSQRLAQTMNGRVDTDVRRPYPTAVPGRPPSPAQDRMYGDEITPERRHSDTRYARPVEYPDREAPVSRRDVAPPLGYPAPIASANERLDNGLGRSYGGRPYENPLPREARKDPPIRDAIGHRDARAIRDSRDVRGPPSVDARDARGPQSFDAREYDRRGDRRVDQPVNVGPPPRAMEERSKDRKSDDQGRRLPEKPSASTSGPKGKPALGPVDSYRPGNAAHSPPSTSRSNVRDLPPARDLRDARPFDAGAPVFPPRGAPADPRDVRGYPPPPPAAYGAPVYDDRGYPPPPVDSRMPARGPPAPYGNPYDDRDGYRAPPPSAPAYPYPPEHYRSGRTPPPYRGPVLDGRYEDRYPPAIPAAAAPRPYYDAYDARPVVPAPYDARDRGPYTAPPQAPGYPPAPVRNDDYRRPDARFDDYRRPDERRR